MATREQSVISRLGIFHVDIAKQHKQSNLKTLLMIYVLTFFPAQYRNNPRMVTITGHMFTTTATSSRKKLAR